MTYKSATWPFARLRVATNHITVSSLLGEFRVSRTNLVSISRFGRIRVFADGVKVVRDDNEAVIFWAINTARVLGELQCRGWPVTATP